MSGGEALDVVIVFAFDCSTTSPSWDKVDEEIFCLAQEKLKHFPNSCLGYTYIMSTPNTCTCDMQQVDSADSKATSYEGSSPWSRIACTKNMASGLSEAHKLISYRGHRNRIILFFSDGLINKGDFFDGAENFISEVPVHTFTLGGDAYNHVLRTIAENSQGGTFRPLPIPKNPSLSLPFSQVLDSIFNGTKNPTNNSGRCPLDVVIVYAFDCTYSSPAWDKLDKEIFWLVQEKLKKFKDSFLGYTYVMSSSNTYTSDIKQVDSAETKATGCKVSSLCSTAACTKNMASGLLEAHKLITDHGHLNGIILLFSDGLCNTGDFFDGAEDFMSKVPVYTFTLGGDEYNHVLRAMAANSPGGRFSPIPVPEKPMLSVPFSSMLDCILTDNANVNIDNFSKKDPKQHVVKRFPTHTIGGREALDVVIVYAFDCTNSSPAWDKLDTEIFWLVLEKLKHFPNSCLGYTLVMSTPNTCTSDMQQVDSTETKTTFYEGSSARSTIACTKNMASGLSEAHKLISYRGHWNSIILFFSDGLMNKGDFFDGAENFISKVPVHTFTLGGDAYDHVLRDIALNSPGGTFSPLPVPENPSLSLPFSQVLDSIFSGTKNPNNNSGRCPLDVVIVYAFDCTNSSPAWDKLDNEIFWLVQAKLKYFKDSCLGYTIVMLSSNTYASDMKQVDPVETKSTGYKVSSLCSTAACTKNMASGLQEAHKLIREHGHLDGIILLFSDGLCNEGDFFDGAEDFISKVPVYTFTLGGDENNHVLRAMAANSPGGRFSPIPVPDKPMLSVPFSRMLDCILMGKDIINDFPKQDPKLLMGKILLLCQK